MRSEALWTQAASSKWNRYRISPHPAISKTSAFRHSGYNTKYHIRFRRLLISSKLMTTYIPSHSSLTLPVSAFEPSQPHRINSSTQSRSDLHQLCRPSSTTAVRTSFVSVRTLEHWSLLPRYLEDKKAALHCHRASSITIHHLKFHSSCEGYQACAGRMPTTSHLQNKTPQYVLDYVGFSKGHRSRHQNRNIGMRRSTDMFRHTRHRRFSKLLQRQPWSRIM